MVGQRREYTERHRKRDMNRRAEARGRGGSFDSYSWIRTTHNIWSMTSHSQKQTTWKVPALSLKHENQSLVMTYNSMQFEMLQAIVLRTCWMTMP